MLSIGVVWAAYNSPAILRLGPLTLAAATPRMFSTREFGAPQLNANTSSQTRVSRHARCRSSKVVHLAEPGRIVPVSDSGQLPPTLPRQPTGTDPADNATWRWQERATQWLDFPLGRFLDYGCGPCGLMRKVHHFCDECCGVDVDDSKIRTAQEQYTDFQLSIIGPDGRTPYPDDHFDTIAIVEVIEHVPDERAALAELARILKPGGKLLLTAPHRGMLTFLDLGNFKFIFPGLHRWIHLRVLRNREYYERRFVQAEGKGLVGDISVASERETWHRHYKPKQIESFCPDSLRLDRLAVYFPGMRAFMLATAILRVCTFGKCKRLFWPFSALERRISRTRSRAGDQLVMMFVKQPRANRPLKK